MHVVTRNDEHGHADGLGGFVQRIGEDLKILAHDEVELAREEAHRVARSAAAEAAMLVIASFVAVVGLAMLCVTAVVAADAIIASLAIRLLVMTGIYLVGGGLLARYAFHRLGQSLRAPLEQPAKQVRLTAVAVKEALSSDRGDTHHA